MNHIGTKLSIVLATSLLSTSAFALKVMPPDDEPTFRQKVLAANDTDGDGRISEAEFKAMQAARKQAQGTSHAQMLQRYDLDKNGKLDQAELARRKADHHARLLPDFDANRNGVLDPAERKQFLAKRLQTKLGRRFTLMVLRFDANRDNKLQATEMPGKAKGKGKAKRFRAIDTDRDGAIERGEFVAHGAKVAKHKQAKQKKHVKAARLIKKQGHTL